MDMKKKQILTRPKFRDMAFALFVLSILLLLLVMNIVFQNLFFSL